jgi:hypothetical protein
MFLFAGFNERMKMALLHLMDDGLWMLDYDITPVEFWPYTTLVYDVVMTGPRDKFRKIEDEIIELFKAADIKAHSENKSAFGVKDHIGMMWFFGFKDFRFDLGMSVRSDTWSKPYTKGSMGETGTFRR